MPSSVINHIIQLAKKELQPLLKDRCLLFVVQDGAALDLAFKHFSGEGEKSNT